MTVKAALVFSISVHMPEVATAKVGNHGDKVIFVPGRTHFQQQVFRLEIPMHPSTYCQIQRQEQAMVQKQLTHEIPLQQLTVRFGGCHEGPGDTPNSSSRIAGDRWVSGGAQCVQGS